jgi:hypothetical protein
MIVSLSVYVWGQPQSGAGFSNFITRQNDTLFDGTEVFRFISFNVPNLHLLEDHFPFSEENNWALPTQFEIRDAMQSVTDAGGTVIRQYCLRIQRSHEPQFLPKHLTARHTFYEPAFLVMDTVLALANEYGIRLIIPILEGPPWWGPKNEFARLRDGNYRFDSPEIREDYKHLVSYVLNRRNSVTGTLYKDDKAILCWETGNEMPTTNSFLKEMSAFFKSIDSNHLLMDGNYGVRNAALDDPNVDIVSNHFYKKPAILIRKDISRINKRKAYVIGEWGFSEKKCNEILDQTLKSSASGALIWSLRYRHRDGGFTWHKNEGLHWPGGFSRSELTGEQNILNTVRTSAYAIRKMPQPPLQPPAPPHLLPIPHPSFISWQGSTRANRYSIERANNLLDDNWITVGDSIDETKVAYRPLFCDTSVIIGENYYYRIIAHGPGGNSSPSNIIGPVKVDKHILVDEFLPEMQKHHANKKTEFTNTNPWQFKYDFHRQKGSSGDYLEYEVDGNITAVRLFAFFPKKSKPFTISIGANTNRFTQIKHQTSAYPYTSTNPRDRLWLPVLFTADSITIQGNRVKISFPGGSGQLGRCEIEYH